MSWDTRFFHLAQVVATWSKDPNEQVGAVIVSSDKRHFSVGYNGLPKGYPDDVVMERSQKNALSLHAEDNALAQASTDVTDWTMYVTKAPCLRCMLAMHRAGIKRVVSYGIRPDSKWAGDQQAAVDFASHHTDIELAYMEAP